MLKTILLTFWFIAMGYLVMVYTRYLAIYDFDGRMGHNCGPQSNAPCR